MDRRQMKSRFNREIVPVSVNVSACWSKTTAASRENIRNRLDGRGNGTPNGVEKHSRPLLFSVMDDAGVGETSSGRPEDRYGCRTVEADLAWEQT